MPDSNQKVIGGAAAPAVGLTPLSMLGEGQHVFESWAHGMGELTAEMTHFLQRRVQEDLATWSRLATCRNVQEAFELQRGAAERAIAEYVDEVGKLSNLVLRAANPGHTAPQEKPTL